MCDENLEAEQKKASVALQDISLQTTAKKISMNIYYDIWVFNRWAAIMQIYGGKRKANF